jgi:hypothetical protein
MLVCGGFGAFIADQKGRSVLDGFVSGFILGPIGIAWEFFRPYDSDFEESFMKKSGEDRESFRLIAESYPKQRHMPHGEVDERRAKEAG